MKTGTHHTVVVFDVLGTLVDQAGSLQRLVAAATGISGRAAATAVDAWLDHVARAERAIVERRRAFVRGHVLNAEAVTRLAADGLLPPGHHHELATAFQRLRPWPDTVTGLDRLAAAVTVLGLSNASRRDLTGLSAATGMRWHQLLSAEDADTVKPDPAVYELALSAVPAAAAPPFMAAAHAWDLRAAAAAGMRTAYVPRPAGDPPRPDDHFDLVADDLADLHAQLLALPENT